MHNVTYIVLYQNKWKNIKQNENGLLKKHKIKLWTKQIANISLL